MLNLASWHIDVWERRDTAPYILNLSARWKWMVSCMLPSRMLAQNFSNEQIYMNNSLFWDTMPCSLLIVNLCFVGMCHLHLQGWRVSQARNQCEECSKLPRWGWRSHAPSIYWLTFNILHKVNIPEHETHHNYHCKNHLSYTKIYFLHRSSSQHHMHHYFRFIHCIIKRQISHELHP
jgi:hypothetical protein